MSSEPENPIDDLDEVGRTCPRCGDQTDFPEITNGQVCMECCADLERAKAKKARRPKDRS